MKNLIKILLLSALIFSFAESKAQSNLGTMLSTSSLALDTVTNTGTEVMTLAVPLSQASVTVLVKVTELTGTTAGAVKLLGSIDGGTTYAILDGAGTFSPADVAGAQTFSWQIKPSAYTHYRVSYTGVGTMSATISAKVLWRK